MEINSFLESKWPVSNLVLHKKQSPVGLNMNGVLVIH